MSFIGKINLEIGKLIKEKREKTHYTQEKLAGEVKSSQQHISSPKQFECSWIFYHHIQSLNAHSPKQTMITFKNNEEIILPISYVKLEKQYLRTASCILRFAQPLHFQALYS